MCYEQTVPKHKSTIYCHVLYLITPQRQLALCICLLTSIFNFFLYHGFKKLLSVLLRFLKWFSFFFICICLKKTKNTLYKILCIKFCVCMHMCMCEKWCLYKVICNVACIIIWYWTICIKRAWINKNKEFVSSSDKIKKGRWWSKLYFCENIYTQTVCLCISHAYYKSVWESAIYILHKVTGDSCVL